MPVTIEGTDHDASLSARNDHTHCLFCGDQNERSLRLAFTPTAAGGVKGRFTGRPELQGYAGLMHGGIIAALLDAAMTHCLFHRGVRAVTADLHVRYVHPVPGDATVDLEAWVLVPGPPVHRLRAELAHDGRVLAWAEAKFLQQRATAGG
jgi:uncharacterized protein (TIGR00369 family)